MLTLGNILDHSGISQTWIPTQNEMFFFPWGGKRFSHHITAILDFISLQYKCVCIILYNTNIQTQRFSSKHKSFIVRLRTTFPQQFWPFQSPQEGPADHGAAPYLTCLRPRATQSPGVARCGAIAARFGSKTAELLPETSAAGGETGTLAALV